MRPANRVPTKQEHPMSKGNQRTTPRRSSSATSKFGTGFLRAIPIPALSALLLLAVITGIAIAAAPTQTAQEHTVSVLATNAHSFTDDTSAPETLTSHPAGTVPNPAPPQYSGPHATSSYRLLVKNTATGPSPAISLTSTAPRRAQAFTTGNHPGGYFLSTIGVKLGEIDNTSTTLFA